MRAFSQRVGPRRSQKSTVSALDAVSEERVTYVPSEDDESESGKSRWPGTEVAVHVRHQATITGPHTAHETCHIPRVYKRVQEIVGAEGRFREIDQSTGCDGDSAKGSTAHRCTTEGTSLN
jgi:hypothetical protein